MLEKLPSGVGESLLKQRAGLENTVFYKLQRGALAHIDVSSPAFAAEGAIPTRFTADGEGISPPLGWQGIPAEAAGVIVIVEDADSPTPQPLVHAIVVNLPGEDGTLGEGALNSPKHAGIGLQTGRNSFLSEAWLPPDPPPGHGTHRYVFQVYALRAGVELSETPGRHQVFDALSSHALGAGYCIGTYERAVRIAAGEADFARVTP